MKLQYSQTKEEFEAEIVEIEERDLKRIAKEKQFQFDWSKEKNVFKITHVTHFFGKRIESVALQDAR